jgi:hypothetical protein
MLSASKILVVAFAAMLGVAGCDSTGRTVIDVSIYPTITGHYNGEDRRYCYYRFANGHSEKVYRRYGYRHYACPPTITRRAPTGRRY